MEASPPLPADVHQGVSEAVGSDLPLLIDGETGTGKTLLAECIHSCGGRADGPFVRVDCTTLPEGLITSALFGHVRGAYTDAKDSRAGLVESAHRGTLFLDEISELPPGEQARLLSVIEEQEVRRVGATQGVRVDARIIAATNREVLALMKRGRFRPDLYYRCSALRITLPPLRERLEDLPRIVEFILAGLPALGSPPSSGDEPTIAADALRLLVSHPWPGNIRQLKHVLTVARMRAEGGPIRKIHLPEPLMADRSLHVSEDGEVDEVGRPRSRYQAPEDPEVERSNIVEALVRSRGNRTAAAKALGMSRQVLWERMQRYRIEEREWTRAAGAE